MRILGIVSHQHLPTNHWLILKSKDDTFCFPWSLHHFHNAAAFLVEVELGSPWEKPIRFDCSIRSDTCNQPNAWEKSEGRFKSESRFKCLSTVTPPPKTNMSSKKGTISIGNTSSNFQPSIFRCYVSFPGCVYKPSRPVKGNKPQLGYLLTMVINHALTTY